MSETRTRATIEDARRVVSNCVICRGMTPAEREDLLGRIRIRRCVPGETVFLMGDAGDSVIAVIDGAVHISVPSPDGKEIVLAIMHPGDFFGEIGMLDGKERSADAKAVTASTLAVLDRRSVMAFLNEHPRGWANIVEMLCDRLRRTTTQMAEVALLDLPARLAKALLRMVDARAAGTAHSAPIKISQRELGSIVGATREAVNKCLRDWQRSGMIQIQTGAIIIRNRAALDALAENPEP
jgi:CRP-like cAMP-binding protein